MAEYIIGTIVVLVVDILILWGHIDDEKFCRKWGVSKWRDVSSAERCEYLLKARKICEKDVEKLQVPASTRQYQGISCSKLLSKYK